MQLTLPALAACAVLFSFLFTLLPACQSGAGCSPLSGRWSSREGQDFVFQPDGKALWLTRFGSGFDTVTLRYRLDCHHDPTAIDLSDFKNGPHVGRTLYGILEWNSDSSFRLNYEVGTADDVRPKAFDPEQTITFFER